MNKLFSHAISIAFGLTLSLSASATTHTFNFGDKLSGTGPTTLNFASLAFDDVLHKFSLSFNDPNLGNSAYLDLVAVDYTFSRKNSSISIAGVSGGVNKISFNKGNVPTSTYDFVFKIGNSGNKLSNGESVDWKSSNFDFTKLGSSSSPFALHIQGISAPKLNVRNFFNDHEFEDEGEKGLSGWYTLSPVPEPESYAMMIVGLAVMSIVARRRIF